MVLHSLCGKCRWKHRHKVATTLASIGTASLLLLLAIGVQRHMQIGVVAEVVLGHSLCGRCRSIGSSTKIFKPQLMGRNHIRTHVQFVPYKNFTSFSQEHTWHKPKLQLICNSTLRCGVQLLPARSEEVRLQSCSFSPLC